MRYSYFLALLPAFAIATSFANTTSNIYLANGSKDYSYWAQSNNGGSNVGKPVAPTGDPQTAPSVKEYDYSDSNGNMDCDFGAEKHTHTIWVVAQQGVYNTIICSYDETVANCLDPYPPYDTEIKGDGIQPTPGFVPDPPTPSQPYVDICQANISQDNGVLNVHIVVASQPNPMYTGSTKVYQKDFKK